MHGNFRVRGLLNIEVTKVLLVFLGKSAVVRQMGVTFRLDLILLVCHRTGLLREHSQCM